MKIKLFNYWKHNRELEVNFVGYTWNFRIGTHQLALWKNFTPVFNLSRVR